MANHQKLANWIRAVRERDTDRTLDYHSWVSVDRRCVCVTVPKIACSRIKLTLHLLDGNPEPENLGDIHDLGHRLASFDDKQILEMLSSSDWFRFCFVRNPYERLISAYMSQVGNTWNQQYEWLKKDIKKHFNYPHGDASEVLVSFGDFVRYLKVGPESVRRDGHFNVQTRVVQPDLIPYDMVGRFETFAQDFKRVLQHLGAPADILAAASERKNPTMKVHPAIAFDHDLAGIAYGLYEKDFARFSYDRDSWMYA